MAACPCGTPRDDRGMCAHCDAVPVCTRDNRLECESCKQRARVCMACHKRHDTTASAAYCEKADRAAEMRAAG